MTWHIPMPPRPPKPPPERRRAINSDEAMAELRRVCSGDWWPDVLPPPIPEEFEEPSANWPYVAFVASLAALAGAVTYCWGHP